jgi:DNA-binding transcriptional regulator LsrR (DeoR family)
MVAKAGRPEDKPDTSEMYLVARLYYKENVGRYEIAKRLHMDTRKVNRLLAQALALGVVRIDIRETVDGEIGARLQRKFPKLERVFIVPGPEVKTMEQCDDLFRRFGVLAADYFEELLEHHPPGERFHIGVGGGMRLLEFATAVRPRIRDMVRIHTTALIGRGELGADTSFVEPSVAATALWNNCGSVGGNCRYVTVEPYWYETLHVEKKRGVIDAPRALIAKGIARLEKLSTVQSTIRDMENLDAVIAGFGYVDVANEDIGIRNRMAMFNLLQPFVRRNELVSEEVIGDFSYCLFDANGDSDEAWRFFLTAGHFSEHPGVDFYKHMVATGKKVVGIGGPYVSTAIKVALKAEIVNVLIVDEFTARQIADAS